MAVKFLGYEVKGEPQREPPAEWIERIRQAFQAEYELQPVVKEQCGQTKEDS